MKSRDTGKVHNKIINRLERQERQEAFQRGRFFKLKLPEIHNKLNQALLLEKIVETDNPTAVSDSLLKGMKNILRSSEFDFKYFIAPIRDLIPRPNPYSLYMTQYVMEVLIDDPNVIDIYGTDQEIYSVVNEVISRINIQFEREEAEILAKLASNKSLRPGSRQYEIALEQLFNQRYGGPEKQ